MAKTPAIAAAERAGIEFAVHEYEHDPAAASYGLEAALADRKRAEGATGYVTGGISPLGQRRQLPTYVDASALEHETVYVSAGRRGLEIELAPSELVRLTDATVSPIAS